MPKSFVKWGLGSRRQGILVILVLLFSLAVVLLAGCEVKPAEVEKPAEKVEKPEEVSGLPPIEEGFKDCTYCHGSIDYGRVKEKEFGRNLLIFTHVPHINIGTKCSVCHELPVHVKEKVNRPPMHVCYSADCHGLAAAKASGKCEFCHPPAFNLKPGAGSQYGDHIAANFLPPEHAKLAKAEAGKHCEICHLKDFCLGCHGMEIPHPEKFRETEEHGKLARQNIAACTMCHPDYNWCEKCHHKGYDPSMGPWTTQAHPVMVRQQGAEGCFKCHGPSYSPFCADCHVRMFRK